MAEKDLELNVDSLIDEWFGKSEDSEEEKKKKKQKGQMEELIGEPKESSQMKDGQDSGKSQQSADSGEKPAEPPTEKDGQNGRPKDPSNMDHRDADGASGMDYPSAVSSSSSEPAHETTVAKSDKIEISKEDFEILQKAKKDREEEVMRKAKQEQADLIKSVVASAVAEATKPLREENSKLSKKLDDAGKILTAIRKQPRQQKSITKVGAIEKSFGGDQSEEQTTFSKAEMLDAAEELVKSKKITVEQAIELENNGYIFDPNARRALEQHLKKQK